MFLLIPLFRDDINHEQPPKYLSNVPQSSSNSVTLVDTVYSIDRKELLVPFLPSYHLPLNSDPSFLFLKKVLLQIQMLPVQYCVFLNKIPFKMLTLKYLCPKTTL